MGGVAAGSRSVRVLGGLAAVALGVAPVLGSATTALAQTSHAGPGASRAAGRSTTPLVAIGQTPRLPAGASLVGPLNGSTVVHADVVLEPRDAAAMADDASAVASPHSAAFHHYLSVRAFRADFAPGATEVQAVRGELDHLGLHAGPTSADGLVLPIAATAATMGAAFHVSFDAVRQASGKLGFMTTSAPRLPSGISPDVEGIVGLEETITPTRLGLPSGRAHRIRAAQAGAAGVSPAASTATADGGPSACPAARETAKLYNSYTDTQMAHAYGLDGLYSRGILGQGETIGLFELDTFSRRDLALFDKCYFGKSRADQVSLVNIDGGEPPGPGGGEAALDVEDVSAYAPAAHVDVYDAPGTLVGWIDEMSAIVSQDKASVVSISYGLCEAQMLQGSPGLVPTENILFEEGALQGQSFLAASGDSGSETCSRNDDTNLSLSVSDPASQPFVTSVGGTSLKTATDPPSETVWNDGGYAEPGAGGGDGAGGGGVSDVWSMPAWQSAGGVTGVVNDDSSGTSCGAPSGTYCREVPDVSASADQLHGDTVVYGGSWWTIGGTSASSPKWAAVLADTNSLCTTEHDSALGFVDPLLYQIAANPETYGQAFNDITVGNNDVLGLYDGKYPATTGYDMASGLGSPRVTGLGGSPGLASLLCADGTPSSKTPTLTSISPAFGSSAGGTQVTIAGTNLTGITEMQFGPASVAVSPSDVSGGGTQITVTTPPSPVQAFGSGVPVGGVLVEAAGSAGASEPTPTVEFHYVAGTSSSPVPSVYYLSPQSAGGGATVTIYGSGFEAGTPTVAFGGVAATSVSVVSDSELTATVPAEQAGTDCVTESEGVPTSNLCQAQVTVTNSAGTSATAPISPPPSGLIAYLSLLPSPGTENVPAVTEFDYASRVSLTSVSPTPIGSNPYYLFGGDPATPPILTIDGSGFNYFSLDEVEAKVPSRASLDQPLFVGVLNWTSIEVAAPLLVRNPYVTGPTAGPPSIDISAVSAGERSNTLTAAVAPVGLTATSISAKDGSDAGGRRVTISGSNLESVTAAVWTPRGYFASGVSTTDVTSAKPGAVTFVTPASVAGAGYWMVCNPSQCVGSSRTTSFTYFDPGVPVVSGFTPSHGSAGGGEQITVSGSGLGSVVGVRFGTTFAPAENPSNFAGQSTSKVIATVPPGLIGKSVRLTVVTLAGTSRPSAGRFRYVRGAPGPVSHLGAVVRPGAVLLHWRRPSSNGGSPITGYSVAAYARRPGRIACRGQAYFASSGPAGSLHVPPTARSAELPLLPSVAGYAVCVTSYSALGRMTTHVTHLVRVTKLGDDGYLVGAADGYTAGYGSFAGAPAAAGGTTLTHPVIAVALGPVRLGYFGPGSSAIGYWEMTSNGAVKSVDEPYYGSLSSTGHGSAVALLASPGGYGYYIVTSTGYVRDRGHVRQLGSVRHRLPSPISAAALTPDGGGYWLVSKDGVVHAFGDARLLGSPSHVSGSVVAILPVPSGRGYWIVTSTGEVLAFGRAHAPYGAPPKSVASDPVVSAAAAPLGDGYWLLTASGAVLPFGHAVPEGSPAGRLESRAAAITA